MSQEYKPPKCTSCNKIITHFENAVRFYCPNCGKAIIWRCEKCRKFSRKYTCPSCGYVGP